MNRLIRLSLALALAVSVSGCTASGFAGLPQGLGFVKPPAAAAHRAAQQHPPGREAQSHAETPDVDVEGEWVMDDGNVEHIRRTFDGMYVAPVDRGGGAHYVQIGPNLYRYAHPRRQETYQFDTDQSVTWTSNDERNLTIRLHRR